MRLAWLVPIDECKPLCRLASVEIENAGFIVVDPHEVFAVYWPFQAEQVGDATVQTFAIVKVSSDWQKTTVNLRAPLVINTEKQIGAQLILSDSKYQFAESLVRN